MRQSGKNCQGSGLEQVSTKYPHQSACLWAFATFLKTYLNLAHKLQTILVLSTKIGVF